MPGTERREVHGGREEEEMRNKRETKYILYPP